MRRNRSCNPARVRSWSFVNAPTKLVIVIFSLFWGKLSFSFSPLIRTAQSDASVKCHQNDMSITLPKALLLGLKRKHITLRDVNCVATETENPL